MYADDPVHLNRRPAPDTTQNYDLNLSAAEDPHLVHEAGLADVGVAAHQQRAGGGVDARQPPHVLPHLHRIGFTGS